MAVVGHGFSLATKPLNASRILATGAGSTWSFNMVYVFGFQLARNTFYVKLMFEECCKNM